MIFPFLFLLAGIITWTFMEYVIHRFWGHTKKKNPRNPFTTEHRRHHAEFDYFAAAYKKAAAAIIVLSVLTVALGIPFGWLNGFMYGIGLAGMYLTYEAIHTMAHRMAPLTIYGRWYRKHHFYHHFRNPKKNHGVSSPIWDVVFGTYVPVKEVIVPGRGIPLRWLFDGEGNIKPRFQKDYRLAGKR